MKLLRRFYDPGTVALTTTPLIRKSPLTLIRQHAPDAAIAFNAVVPEFYEAAARWLDLSA